MGHVASFVQQGIRSIVSWRTQSYLRILWIFVGNIMETTKHVDIFSIVSLLQQMFVRE
jgi:hypothetical protein